MADTSYIHVIKPFPLPKGFDPEGTDIVRCFDNPEMGYLKPRQDVVYTFLMLNSSRFYVDHWTAEQAEIEIGRCPDNSKIIFVSPAFSYEDCVKIQGMVRFRDLCLTRMIELWR